MFRQVSGPPNIKDLVCGQRIFKSRDWSLRAGSRSRMVTLCNLRRIVAKSGDSCTLLLNHWSSFLLGTFKILSFRYSEIYRKWLLTVFTSLNFTALDMAPLPYLEFCYGKQYGGSSESWN